MSFKLGFIAEEPEELTCETCIAADGAPISAHPPRPSLVRVYFPDRDAAYTYYNDAFTLHKGDLVYVDGKLSGLRGRVADVQYSFKIKLSDYRRVIHRIDTDVTGTFHMAGSHFVTFDKEALLPEKALRWFKAPDSAADDTVCGQDNRSFLLSDLKEMDVSSAVAERGHEYYIKNRVRYLHLAEEKGFAIVQGSHVYEVEFTYRNNEIRNLVCNCFCVGHCKHSFAAMLQLREILDWIEENKPAAAEPLCFTAIDKSTFFAFAVSGKETGTITI